MPLIEVANFTKDYGHERGVFNISFQINEGEVYGFLGPNGAGKSTTIRHLMGFSKPDKGNVRIFGLDCFQNYSEILKSVGYIPGEIALPDGLTGWQFIDMMMKMKGITSDKFMRELLQMFKLDPSNETKYMSLGDKRKLAIVAAFMGDPDILILDEPTSGLDPIMQDVFVKLIKQKKKEGKTIMLSSHLFNEIDTTCDRIAIIKDGHIVSEFIADDLKHATLKSYKASFKTKKDCNSFLSKNKKSDYLSIVSSDPYNLDVLFKCDDAKINHVIEELSFYQVSHFTHLKETLEDYFMSYYVGNKDFGGTL